MKCNEKQNKHNKHVHKNAYTQLIVMRSTPKTSAQPLNWNLITNITLATIPNERCFVIIRSLILIGPVPSQFFISKIHFTGVL